MLYQEESRSAAQAICVVCGGEDFEAGPSGRLARGNQTPRCVKCRSLERHRALRLIYDNIPDEFFSSAKCLQFARDNAAPRDRFDSFELSVFDEENSIDMMRIDRPDASYDWVIANHVVEHLANDLAGMAELMRIAGPCGIVQITVPAPKARLKSEVLPWPDLVKTFHFHTYGSDFPLLMKPALKGCAGLEVISRDPSTQTWDVAYFFSASRSHLYKLGDALVARHVPVLSCY